MFLSRNNKNNIYPCKPQFYYIKVGFKGVKIKKEGFRDGPARPHNFVEMDHEIISTAILPLPLIQEGLLSVTDKGMCTGIYHLGDN